MLMQQVWLVSAIQKTVRMVPMVLMKADDEHTRKPVSFCRLLQEVNRRIYSFGASPKRTGEVRLVDEEQRFSIDADIIRVQEVLGYQPLENRGQLLGR